MEEDPRNPATLSAAWRRSGAPDDFVALAESTPSGARRDRLVALFGPPVVVSELADGGESWLYVKADADRGRFESFSLALSPDGGFLRLNRKPIE